MLRTSRVRRNEGQIDLGLCRRREFDLRFLCRFLEALQRELVATQINALFFLEFIGEIVDEPHIEVFAAQERIAVRGLHLENTIANLEDGHVKRATAKVIDRDGARFLLVQPVRKRGSRRLIDDAQHFEAGDLAGILGRLTLRVVEIGWHRDDGLLNLLPEIGFRRLFHLLQDERGYLRGRVSLTVDLNPGVAIRSLGDLVRDQLLVLLDHRVVVAPADQALDCEDRLFGIGYRLALGRLSNQTLAVVGEGHDRRRGPHAFSVFDNLRRLAFHDGDARIGGAEVDADDLAHGSSSQLRQAGRATWRPSGEYRRLIRRPPIQPPGYSFRRIFAAYGSYRRGPGGRKSVGHEIARVGR